MLSAAAQSISEQYRLTDLPVMAAARLSRSRSSEVIRIVTIAGRALRTFDFKTGRLVVVGCRVGSVDDDIRHDRSGVWSMIDPSVS